MKILSLFALILLGLSACSPAPHNPAVNTTTPHSPLYALNAQEHRVKFEALYQSRAKNLAELDAYDLRSEIKEVTAFLFGTLTHREIGGVQKGEKIIPHIDQAVIKGGYVMVPYTYEATWMIHNNALIQNPLSLPIPYSIAGLNTPGWKNCNDSGEHRDDWGFFWYFWDPSRPGCDHKAQRHYQEVDVQIGVETPQTTLSRPEYSRLIHTKNGVPTLSMTFAFGYIEEAYPADPFVDTDHGMKEFRMFHNRVKSQLLRLNFEETPLLQKDISRGKTRIGTKFTGNKNGVQVEVSILAAAGVDQMDIFAYSYAQNHDGFFGWFGHSRVGSGFDAEMFAYKLNANPQRYSITPDYQMIYWAGCNSYSYYTLPFFELKSRLNPGADPHGTANLDLLSNALPSLFVLNAENAQILYAALFNWEAATSYQDIVQSIETSAAAWGREVIVNVLGDEDNPQ